MEIKVNFECALKILEKNGFEVEKKAEEGSPLTAKKILEGSDPNKVELLQVHCGAPYVKFEAKVDNDMQKVIIDALNQGLEGMMKGAQAITAKKAA